MLPALIGLRRIPAEHSELEPAWRRFATLTDSPQRSALAEVLGLLASGERLAARTAFAQRGLARDLATRRFFLSQAGHESFHATVFTAGQRALQQTSKANHDAAFSEFQSALAQALEDCALPESVVGCQVVLEGLGEALLGEIDEGIRARGFGLDRLRRLILEQERLHHGFGVTLLEQAVRTGTANAAVIRRAVAQYVQLAITILDRNRRLFTAFDVAPLSLQARFLATIPPAWR